MSDELKFRDRIVELRRVPAGDLVDNPKNWRGHPESQKRALRSLVAKIGFAGAELVRVLDDGRLMLIDGHVRKKEFKNQVLPVLVTDLNAEEADLLLATFDRIGAEATQDDEAVEKLLADVGSYFEDIDQMMIDVWGDEWRQDQDGQTSDSGAQIDRADELEQVWRCERDQLWIIPSKSCRGNHLLFCGDSTNADDVNRLFENGARYAMVFTDPPYGINYDHASTGRAKSKFDKLQNDDLSGDEFREFNVKWLKAVLPHQLENASFYVCGANRTAHNLILAAIECGICYAVPLVWVKQRFALNWDRYHPQHEWIFYGGEGSKPTGKTSRWYGENNESTVWQIDRDHSGDYDHPTQKPVELPARAIRNSSTYDEIVLDPFAGSGSTLVACEQLGRQGRCIEIEPKYCAVILQRLADMGFEPELAK